MTRIATLTLNPAMDLAVRTPRVVATEKLRCSAPRHDPGGGGINVARVVSTLGGDALAVYPAGGPFGEMLRRALDAIGLAHLPVAISGDTRESFTVDEQASGLQYRFVLPGPRLSEQERLGCLAALRGLHPAPAYLVVSGSFTPGIEPSFFDELLALAGQVGARLVVDLSGEPLAYAARRGGAYLIKPSLNELASLIGRMPESEREQEGALRELIAAGAAEVIVLSLGAAGALYASGDRLERIAAPSVPMVSAVGAGDSMLGAVVLALAQGRELGDAVRYGVAAGAATVMRPGTQLCLREDVERLFRGG
ncbi:1-phosphofructokinase family hexose kinase [Stutzerimonas balearica]|uniref:1-phosphofructokinase family hexose kinase n=1 Tax=Stutzerimonas balearica TaxID=74829 RepID=UPI00077342B5|nr:1-phosphofructokinase family hexose kinase [Stutzerimonas balearica]MBS4149158.1 1-phosphofructokinase family hexose kinase [Stutzerimonas balearica]MCZ4127327.1 1-phosphofructokinase family hexose kinase [Stutzerimonas balearica]OMG67722.1 phosphofructokinase [Stutzerimonas balearica]